MDEFISRLETYGARIAFVDDAGGSSYQSLGEGIRRHVCAWSGQIRPGQVVALLADYSAAAISIFFALARLKAILVPLASTNQRDVDERIETADADWIIRVEGHGEALLQARKAAGDRHPLQETLAEAGHPGLILFSSGSTGRPKAMLHDLHNLASLYASKREKSVVFLVFLMFDHIGGLNTLLNGLSMGAQMVFSHRRDPEEVCRLIQAFGVHVLPASPTFLNLLLMSRCHERFDLGTLRMITYGTEPMPEPLLQRIHAAFPRARLLQTFGTSETGIAQTVSRSSSSTLIKVEDPHAETRIVDGELWIRSRARILGYLNAPMANFTDDGWYRTGDLVESAEDGYFRIKGRREDVINVGGQKVLPVEVETVLLALDWVSDCLVYAEDSTITGQMVAAQVVLNGLVDPAQARKRIKAHCNQFLDRFKVPVRITFVEKTACSDRFKKSRVPGRSAP